MICKACSKEIEEKYSRDKYCPYCGELLNSKVEYRIFIIPEEKLNDLIEEYKVFGYELDSKRINSDELLEVKLIRTNTSKGVKKLEKEYEELKSNLINIDEMVPRPTFFNFWLYTNIALLLALTLPATIFVVMDGDFAILVAFYIFASPFFVFIMIILNKRKKIKKEYLEKVEKYQRINEEIQHKMDVIVEEAR